MKGLYIHIPFCSYICTYCDFVKQVPRNDEMVDKYVKHLILELETYKSHYKDVSTVYIGGGTPSILSEKQIEPLLKYLSKNIKPIEFTIEINPDSYTHEKGLLYYKYGINRTSVGVQTFNQTHLKKLNRQHSNEDVFNTIKSLREIGFKNISIDLIYSLINQTIEELKIDLDYISKIDIDHVSCYTLAIEEKTFLHYLYQKGLIKENSEDLEANMYELLNEELEKQGFEQYEISNYAKNKKYSRHNLIYWDQDEYIGAGMGAHGFIDGYRTYNNINYYPYLKNPLKEKVEELEEETLANHLIFGLRKLKGVNIELFNSKYNTNIFEKYPEINDKIIEGLVIYEKPYLKLTKKGLLLGNEVFRIFV